MHNKFTILPRSFFASTIISKSILIIGLTLLLSGCVTFNDPEVSQEYTSDPVASLGTTTTVGQSFISRRPRLNGLTIWLSSLPVGESTTFSNIPIPIKAELFHLPEDQTPIFTTTQVTSVASTSTPFTIRFPNLGDKANISYYVKLSSNSDTIQILGRNEDSYSSGQAYVNAEPVNADIAFRATYDYDEASFVFDFNEALKQSWLIIPLLAVLFIPGWLLLDFSGLSIKFDLIEQWAISIGLSLSIVPVLMVWTTLLNIKSSRDGILVFYSLLGAIFIIRLVQKFLIVYKNRQTRKASNPNQTNFLTGPLSTFTHGQFIALIAIFLGTLTIRLIMVRDLATPAWVDSVHHALFTRLIITNGNYPSSYLPFLDLPVASYHLGFHSIAATFTLLSGLKLEQALLILGQVLNAMVVFSVYLITKTLTRRVSAGLFSAVITGFLTPMPAYYSSWGRYTELTGLIILPIAFAFLHSFKFVLTIALKRWMIFLGAITSAGLFMIHYRVVFFFALLIFSYLLITLPSDRDEPLHLKSTLQYSLSIAVVGIVFVAPWLYKTIQTIILPIMISGITSNPIPFFQDFSWAYLTSALGKQSLILASLGLVWGMINKQRFTLLLIIWVVLLFFVANLGALKLPGDGLISTSSVEIMLFIPISIFGGYLIDQILFYWKTLVPRKFHPGLTIITGIVMGIVSFIGARQLVTIINPITILTRSTDIPALEWVRNNIPDGEMIVINPSPWGYGIYAGYDGGYWISPLAGKATLPPPVLYGLGSLSSQINEMSEKIISMGSNPITLREFLIQQQYKYVFIGARGGAISPAKLNESGLFIVRYHQSGVWIFEVRP